MKIYILGGSGSGKTTLAEDIAVRFPVPHYELDQIGLKNGKVTDDDAFAIAGQPGWVTDGSYLIWTDPLLYQADTIVLLEVSWSVAAWRMIRRHITKSLHGTNPYPGFNGIKLLFKLLKDNRKQYLNQIDPALAECMRAYLVEQRASAGPPTPESMRKDVETYLMLSVPPTADFYANILKSIKRKYLS